MWLDLRQWAQTIKIVIAMPGTTRKPPPLKGRGAKQPRLVNSSLYLFVCLVRY